MPLDFPSSPSLNQTYTFNGRTWKWNGTGWQLESPLLATSSIADAAVTTAKIADSAVTSAKIADGTIVNGDLSAGHHTWDSSGNHTITGDITLSGVGKKIKADFTSGTVANRVYFQTTTANDFTVVGALPNGTGTASAFMATNNSNPTNASIGSLIASSSSVILESSRLGTGTYLPLVFNTNGSEQVRISTSGQLSVTGAGSASAPVYSKSDDLNTGIFFPAADTVGIATNGAEALRVTSDAYLRMAASTGGIQFNGDTAAANALDDYEEGTWTPTISSGSISGAVGYYRKIGTTVIAVGFFQPSGGTLTLTDKTVSLPFTNVSQECVCVAGNRDLFAVTAHNAFVQANSATIRYTSNTTTAANGSICTFNVVYSTT